MTIFYNYITGKKLNKKNNKYFGYKLAKFL